MQTTPCWLPSIWCVGNHLWLRAQTHAAIWRAGHGLIQYTHGGFMNALIGRAEHPRLSSESVRSAPETERLSAFETHFQYPRSVRGPR